MAADGESPYRSTLFPVDDQWLIVGVLVVGALLVDTAVPELTQLIGLAAFVAATPDTWVPLLVVVLLMGGALVIEALGRSDRRERRAWWAAGAAAVAGVVWFFRGGRVDWLATSDWVKEWTYLAALQHSLRRGELPWFLTESFQGTTRFFANPETNVAPQALLLTVVDGPTFVVLQFAVLLSLGLWAAYHLAVDLRLGPIASLTFLVVFLLNGHLIAHLETGHLQWAGYALLPAVFLFVHRAAAGERGPRTLAGLALTLALIQWVGGWHVFVWCVIFIGAFVALDRSRWRFGAALALLVAALSAVRVVPALAFYDAPDPEFVGSYQRLSILAGALIGDVRRTTDGLNWWEYNAFVGWVGFVLAAAGLTAPLSRQWRHSVASLWAPSVLMLVLSTYNLYAATLFRLPGFESQRVATRLLVVALLGFTLIACVQLDAWLGRRRPSRRRLGALALAGLLLAAQLVAHANSRRPRPDRGVAMPSTAVVSDSRPEAAYVASVGAGAAISLGAAVAGGLMWRRRRFTSGD